MAIPAPAPLAAVNVKITRTPLAGGGSTTYTESRDAPLRRVRRCAAHLTQSIGDQNGILELDNVGGYFASWSSGDVLRIEVQRPQDAAYSLLLEGFVGEPVERPGARPLLTVPIVGPNSILDLIVLEDEVAYEDTAYTDMFDDLCTTYLTGYTRTITADAAAGSMTFRAGMKLREALDIIRRALVAATSPAKWEWVASKDGATKEIRLFKRSAVSQATLSYAEALVGTQRSRGSAYHVVNKAKVLGATVPSQVIDKTTLAAAGEVILDATTDWAAQPFPALDSPLSAHTLLGDRSTGRDPPSLQGIVARNSDNVDRLTYGIQLRTGVTVLRNSALSGGTIAGMTDRNSGTNAQWAGTVLEKELIVWDMGSAVRAGLYVNRITAPAGTTMRLYGSNDDAAYTQIVSVLNPGGADRADVPSNVGPWRYYKITSTGAVGTVTIAEAHILEYANLATPATTPNNLYMDYDGGGVSTVASTGGGTKTEMYRVNWGSAQPWVKLVFKHIESAVEALISLRWQKSSDGAAWEDIAVLSTTTSSVVDTIYLDGEGDFQYLRLIVQDDRAGGSASRNFSVDYLWAFQHTTAWGTPLSGDAMRGSAWTWDVSSMVAHPAAFEETTWPAPRLALTTGRLYWFIYKPQSGASATSWWSLDYGTDAAAPTAALVSTTSGSTWSAIAANATLLHRTEFNEHQLVGEAEDAASQATFANFVPGGVLYGGLSDEALITQDMVDKEAEALVAGRKAIKQRVQYVVALRPALTTGSPVTLAPDNLLPLGTSGDLDVLEVQHEAIPGGKTTLILNDHAPEVALASESALAYATGRSI